MNKKELQLARRRIAAAKRIIELKTRIVFVQNMAFSWLQKNALVLANQTRNEAYIQSGFKIPDKAWRWTLKTRTYNRLLLIKIRKEAIEKIRKFRRGVQN